jgi:hypothetical protein
MTAAIAAAVGLGSATFPGLFLDGRCSKTYNHCSKPTSGLQAQLTGFGTAKMATAADATFCIGSATSTERFWTTTVPTPTTAFSKPTAGFHKQRSILNSRDDHRRRHRRWGRVSDLRGPFSDGRCSKTDARCFKTYNRFSETTVGFEQPR